MSKNGLMRAGIEPAPYVSWIFKASALSTEPLLFDFFSNRLDSPYNTCVTGIAIAISAPIFDLT